MLKRVLFSVVGAIAALSIGTAGAYFTTQVQVADSMIRAGDVAISTVPTTAPLSINSLAPGETASRPMSVVNDGSLPVDVVVSAKKISGITDFFNSLTTRVSCNDTELYNGPLSALKTAPLRIAPGAKGDLRFEIGLPSDAANTLADAYTKVSVYVDAEQAH